MLPIHLSKNQFQDFVMRIKMREIFNLHLSARGIQFNFPVFTQSKGHNPGECMAFSIDVQDLFYYLPHEKLLQSVQGFIGVDNYEVFFRNASGTSVEHSRSCWCFTWIPHMWDGKGNSAYRSREYALGQVLHLCQVISFWVPWTGFSTENCQVCMKKCTTMWMTTSSLHRSIDLKIAGTGSWKSLRKMAVVCSSRPKCQLMAKFSSWIKNCFQTGHVCWTYMPRTCKPLLEYSLGHSSWTREGFLNRACNRLSRSTASTQIVKASLSKCGGLRWRVTLIAN